MLSVKSIRAATFGAMVGSLALGSSAGAQGEYALTIRNHRFEPAELFIPANQKVELHVTNADATPEEFEAASLHREKVIPAGQTLTIYVGPVAPGRYEFFGDFNPDTARGALFAK